MVGRNFVWEITSVGESGKFGKRLAAVPGAPKGKCAAVVLCSDGPTGWMSCKAAVLSIGAGHKNLRYMHGGFADWTAKNCAVER